MTSIMSSMDEKKIPEKYQCLQLNQYNEEGLDLSLESRPIPEPGPGEVLVKMEAASINPSDLMFMKGLYGIRKRLPTVPGFEGSGTVVKSGPGLTGRFMLGKRVACTAPVTGDGVYAEYMITQASLCMPLIKEVSFEQGATSLVNPLTALALLDIARKAKIKTVVQTAAAGALGRMIARLAHSMNIETINIVRKPEQVKILQEEGAEHVLNIEEAGFDSSLRKLAKKLNAKMVFEAVSGETLQRVTQAMPLESRIIVYGALSQQPVNVHPADLIFQNKKIEGFWLSSFMTEKSTFSLLSTGRRAQKLLASELKTHIQERFSIQDGIKAIESYQNNMSSGKVLIRF